MQPVSSIPGLGIAQPLPAKPLPCAGLHLARLLGGPAQSRAGSRFVVDVDGG